MTKTEDQAVTNVGEQMQDAGVVPHKKGKHYSPILRQNVLAELRKPGAEAKRIAERFRVGESTVASWRLQYIGRTQTRANTRQAATKTAEPVQTPSATNIQDVASVLSRDSAPASDSVVLTRQEARTLALVVRDTVKRMEGADELTLGRLALLALKLAG